MESRFVIAVCLTALISFPLQAAIYQWTDEQGHVHFSDRPTHESAKEKDVRVAPGNGSGKQAIPEDRKALRQRMLDVYEQERLEKREEEEKRRQERKQRKQQCLDARARYDMYNNAGSIYDYTSGGERSYLDKQERKQYINQLKAEVERYCN
ncbi:MAG: DUF4124 domain-containing protein [Candidatus Thiodiazotropha sp.]|jgi:hypothetical protein